MTAWNPSQYERFKDERSRPFFDLVALVKPKPGMRVVDLGCGTGALTAKMHEGLGAAETLAIDSSAEMLAKGTPVSGLRFELGDLGAFDGHGAWDLVFSNAALHWVDDHPALLARLARALAPDGQLAAQVPANHDHVAHTVAQEIAREEPFATALGGHVRSSPVLRPEEYATLLDKLGFAEQKVHLEVYPHHLPSRGDVIEWVKGTLLTDYQSRLSPDVFARFLERYRERLFTRIEDTRPYFYPFKRIFIWGRR